MKQKKASQAFAAEFCMEAGLLLKSGATVSDSLSVLLKEAEDGKTDGTSTEILRQLSAACGEGKSLSDAFEKVPAFPKYMQDMIKLGEKTGRLSETMLSLSDYFTNRINLGKSIRNAVVYPLFLFIAVIAVFILLITKILPVFDDVFARMGMRMSRAAAFLLDMGSFISRYGLYIIFAAAVFAALIVVFRKKLFSRGKLGKKVSAGRFASAMHTALSSGLTLDEALELSAQVSGDNAVSDAAERCSEEIASGKSFPEAVEDTGLLSPVSARLLSIGAHAGELNTVMKEISERYEADVKESIDRRISVLEPVLVITVSLFVGFVLFSVMLPLTEIMSSLG